MRAATTRLVLTTLCALLISTALTACRARNEGRMLARANIAPILLFNGTGTSPGDVAALEKILNEREPQLFDSQFSTVERNERIADPGISSADCSGWKFRYTSATA